MRVLLISILGLFWYLPEKANEIIYDKAVLYGTKKLKETEFYKFMGSDRWEYYFINTSKNGKFVILHYDIQFTNFCDTIINKIHEQNSGAFRATMKRIDGVIVYRLINKELNWVRTLNVNLESMTFVSTASRGVVKYNLSIGICWGR